MSETFDKLKAMLASKGSLSDDNIRAVVDAHGEMTGEEQAALSAEIHERQRAAQTTVTMEDYLAAMKVLDTAAEGSDEYKQAEIIIEKFEKAN